MYILCKKAEVYFTTQKTRRSFEIKKLLGILREVNMDKYRHRVRKLTEEQRRRKSDLSTKRL
jgi:hypothetical protein